ncbi:hypothetical protein [Halobacterium litoreum]|uniref:Uncharacterized protein n=1 Tax=Halobacterium litoreum TaxID=2039234 RepID=A0ABD5NFY1_9EURY|nr:hypothetical protein [Halobacterium litoreum]UHH12896.1 hypothetical protein LT972_12100 [Halobacterium litoreum]
MTATTQERHPGDTRVSASKIANESSIPERDVKNFSAFRRGKRAVIERAIECSCSVETTTFDYGANRDYRAVRYNGTLYGLYVTVR